MYLKKYYVLGKIKRRFIFENSNFSMNFIDISIAEKKRRGKE
jgi:hypothetical protein